MEFPFHPIVVSQNGRYGLYNLQQDSVVVPCIYDTYEVLNNDHFVFGLSGHVGLWDGKGHNLLSPEYDEIPSVAPYIFKKRWPVWKDEL